MNIYVLLEGQESGPYTKSEIFNLLKENALPADCLGRWENTTEWQDINRVLASGTMGMFSVQDINQRQLEIPEAPIAIPDFRPPVSPNENPRARPRLNWKKTAYGLAILAFITSGIIYLVFPSNNPSEPSPLSVEETTSTNTVESTPVPQLAPPKKAVIVPLVASQVKPKVSPPSPPMLTKPLETPPPQEVDHKPLADSTILPSTFPVDSSPKPQNFIPQDIKKNPPTSQPSLAKDDFFSIGKITRLISPPKSGPIPSETVRDKTGKREVFVSSLAVQLRTKIEINSEATYARIYFFSADKKLIDGPTNTLGIMEYGNLDKHQMPIKFRPKEWSVVFFEIPQKLRKLSGWNAVIVFGDQYGATAKVYPDGRYSDYQFAERSTVESPKPSDRKGFADPLIEYVVKTHLWRQPEITLLVRLPKGLTSASESKGVLALCVPGGTVLDLKRMLQSTEALDDLGWVFQFAEKHKLLVLCWGSKRLWDKTRNWDDMTEGEQKRENEIFGDIAKAWGEGVTDLCKKLNIPNNNFLLVGGSAGAQYAMRIALRQPRFFHAVCLNIPSSFDRPTIEANRILWAIVTGELEAGYNRSLRFYAQCRELGYPILYKAIPLVGHRSNGDSNAVSEAFLEWALTLKEERSKFEKMLANPFSPLRQAWQKNPLQPWPEHYRTPLFVGDIVNQEVYPWAEQSIIPKSIQVPLPSADLVSAWSNSKLE